MSVTCVTPSSDEEEVVRKANETRFRVAAGVSRRTCDRFSACPKRIEAGTVWVNEYRIAGWPTPFGGFKDSGVGREQAKEGPDEYRQTKSSRMWNATVALAPDCASDRTRSRGRVREDV
ncbi:aldehyde dehydrogenase family protein [Halobellus sp. GM3]|uniref:aldehyde dehydrogenase family protein n=1 Tax=Halobellus sp. GM3 TaxID=3458410 RepID=UPI00403E15A3